MPNILEQFRSNYPQYKNVSDDDLANGIYNKYYSSKMSRDQFNSKINAQPQLSSPPQEQPTRSGYYADKAATGASSIFGLAGDLNSLARFGSQKIANGIDSLLGYSEDERKQRRADAEKRRQDIEGQEIIPQTPTTQDIRGSLFSNVPVNQEAPTALDRYLGTGLEFGINAAGTGGVGVLARSGVKQGLKNAIPLALSGVTAGAGSEAGGELAKGTAFEPYVRLGGAVVGGGASGLTGAATRTLLSRAAKVAPLVDSLQRIPLSKFNEAQDLIDKSIQLGSPITGAEALAQVTGGNQALSGVQRFTEQSLGGGPIIGEFMANRPQANRLAYESTASQIAPKVENPTQIGPSLQSAAERAVRDTPEYGLFKGSDSALGNGVSAEEAGNTIRPAIAGLLNQAKEQRASLTAPLYDAANRGGYVPVKPTLALVDSIIKSNKGDLQSAAEQAKSLLFRADDQSKLDQTVSGLMQTRKGLNSLIDKASRSGDKEASSLLLQIRGSLDDSLANVPKVAIANRAYRDATNTFVAPFEKPGVSSIVKKDQFNSNYEVAPEKLPSIIKNSGPTGVDNFIAASNLGSDGAKAKKAFEDYFVGELRNSATKDGNISADALASVADKNKQILSRFPDIQGRVDALVQSKRGLDKFRAENLIGQIAGTGSATEQAAIILNRSPKFVNEKQIADVVRKLQSKDPEATQSFIRQVLDDHFNADSSSNISGQNQFGGAKFAAGITGNQQTAKNIEAAIKALPGGQTKYEAFNRLMDVFQAQGKRLSANSATDQNARIASGLSGTNLGSVLSPVRTAKSMLEGIALGDQTRFIAKVLTDPRSAELLKKLALTRRNSPAARQLSVQIINIQQNLDNRQNEIPLLPAR